MTNGDIMIVMVKIVLKFKNIISNATNLLDAIKWLKSCSNYYLKHY